MDQIPTAIRELAEDIDRNLGSTGAAGMVMQGIVTSVRLPSSGSATSPPVVFSLLRSVVGCVANYGQDNLSAGLIVQLSGNTVTVKGVLTSGLAVNPPSTTPNPGPPVGVYSPQYLVNRDVVVSLIAWGPPA